MNVDICKSNLLYLYSIVYVYIKKIELKLIKYNKKIPQKIYKEKKKNN